MENEFTNQVSSVASSTEGYYEKYDCYGVKYTKIPSNEEKQ